ncbi:MAG: hypothetical protein H7Y12_03665 [Sphingobacteriaceae bacterium]|nr:hypothetical protein [Cytophagaceae bacterium]
MKTQLLTFTLLTTLGISACVRVRSNQESGVVPPFQKILVFAKQKENAQRYADSYRFAFPAGYQVTTLGFDDLTFGNPDSLIRREAAATGSDVVLWLETRPTGTVTGNQYFTNSDFEQYAELRTWPTNQPFWKMKVALPSQWRQVSPVRVMHQLQRDGILRQTDSARSTAVLSPKNP